MWLFSMYRCGDRQGKIKGPSDGSLDGKAADSVPSPLHRANHESPQMFHNFIKERNHKLIDDNYLQQINILENTFSEKKLFTDNQ